MCKIRAKRGCKNALRRNFSRKRKSFAYPHVSLNRRFSKPEFCDIFLRRQISAARKNVSGGKPERPHSKRKNNATQKSADDDRHTRAEHKFILLRARQGFYVGMLRVCGRKVAALTQNLTRTKDLSVYPIVRLNRRFSKPEFLLIFLRPAISRATHAKIANT